MPLIIKGKHLKEGISHTDIRAVSTDEFFLELAKLTRADYDLIEWRMDYFPDLDDAGLIRETLETARSLTKDVVFLVTIRTEGRDGRAHLSPGELAKLYDEIAQSHSADLIDVECDTLGQEAENVISSLRLRGAGILVTDPLGNLTEDEIEEIDPDVLRRGEEFIFYG